MNKFFLLFPALLIGIICSCSSNDHEVLQPETTSLKLKLTGSFEHDVNTPSSRAMAFDVEKEDGYVGKIKSVDINVQDTDWEAIFFLRKKTAPGNIYSFNATWTATQDGNRVINMKISNKPITINGFSGTLTDGDDYEIMVIGGGGKLKDGNKVSFAHDNEDNQYIGLKNNKIRVPYTSAWTGVSVNGGTIVGNVEMTVQGVLMCINIGNYITQEIPVENLTVTTTNISPEGCFDPTMDGGNGHPKWERCTREGTNEYSTVFTRRVGQKLPAAPGNNKRAAQTIYTYFWGMPVDGKNTIATSTNAEGHLTSSLRISVDDYKVKRFNQTIENANASNTFSYISGRNGFVLTSGTFVRAEMDALRFKTPLEYVGTYNVSPMPKVLCTVNSSFTSGYYRSEFNLGQPQVVPDGYHIPTDTEWYSIFSTSPSGVLKFDNDGLQNNVTERLEVNGEKNTFKAQYNRVRLSSDNIVVYGLRFKNARSEPYNSDYALYPNMQTDNKLCAFRYEIVKKKSGTDNPEGYTLKITSRFLGESKMDTNINTISREDYWNTSTAEDKTIELPLCYYSVNDINSNLLANPDKDARNYISFPIDFSNTRYMCNSYSSSSWNCLQINTASGSGVVGVGRSEYIVIRPFFNNLE